MTSDYYFSVVVFVCFPSLEFAHVRLSVACIFRSLVSFFGLEFSFEYFMYGWI